MLAAVVVAIAGLVAYMERPSGIKQPGLARSTADPSGTLTAAEMEALTPVPPPPSPWQAYATKVSVGPSVQLLGRSTGFAIEGQGPRPRLDDQLAAGFPPESWPGTSLAATYDGGKAWSTSLRVPAGIWSIDFPGAAEGWAAGVSALYRTGDQGRRWSAAAEPQGANLVEVRFDTRGHGLGLDTAGYLHSSVDGGDTWTTQLSGGPYLDLCLSHGDTWLGADTAGRIWAVAPSARSLVFSPPREVVDHLQGAQVSLACAGRTWETIRQPEGMGPNHPAGFLAFASSSGQGFRLALSSGTLGLDAHGEGLASLANGFTLASGVGGSAIVATGSLLPGRLEVETLSPAGRVASISPLRGMPDLDSLPAFMTSAVQGASVLASGFGWLKVDAEIPSGGIQAPDPGRYLSLTWSTPDGGRSWRLLRRVTVGTA